MTYPRNLRRLSACEMVRIFSFFTGRDSRKPSGVYGFKSVSICQIAVSLVPFHWFCVFGMRKSNP